MTLLKKTVFFSVNFIIFHLNGLDSSITYITNKELIQEMDHVSGKKAPKWYLINVLPRYVSTDCMIVGSINIPVHVLEKRLKNSQKWPRDRKIIFYCQGKNPTNSYLSKSAYEITKKLGFTDVQVLEGGLSAWKNNEYPVTGQCKLGHLDI